jgi:hypothetical protein
VYEAQFFLPTTHLHKQFFALVSVIIVQHKAKKTKFSLCFSNWALCHEGILGEWRYSSTHSLTLALDVGDWSASCPGCFTPRERAPGTHWIGGWVSPRAVLDVVVRKIPIPHWELNPRALIIQSVAQCYTNWAMRRENELKYFIYIISFTNYKTISFQKFTYSSVWKFN